MLSKIAGLPWLASLAQIVGTCEKPMPSAAELDLAYLTEMSGRDTDCKIVVFALEVDQTVVEVERQLDFGVRFSEPEKHRPEEFHPVLIRDRHPKGASDHPGCVTEISVKVLGVGKKRRHTLIQFLAGLGNLPSARLSVDERDVVTALQLSEATADG